MSSARDKAKWKLNAKNRILGLIYDPFDKYFERTIGELIAENDALLGAPYLIFTHRSVRYTQVRFARPPQNVPRLAKALAPRLDTLLEEKEHIERSERHFVGNYVTKLLNATDDVTTFIQHLPVPFLQVFEDVFAKSPELVRSNLDLDDAGLAVGVSQNVIDALKVRLMTNLLLGDR